MIVIDISQLEVVSRKTTVEECRELCVFDILATELAMSKTRGCGLAAVQCSLPIRASIMVTDKRVYRMVNPEIIAQSEPIVFTGEACLSQPGKSFNTDRFNKCTVRYTDYDDGLEHTAETDGFNAVVLQHELDHFEGILNGRRAHVYPIKIGRNQPCRECQSNGIVKKWKRCKEHNREAA